MSGPAHHRDVAVLPGERWLPVWDQPVPHNRRHPLVWLLGCHGGAGVSTLEHLLAPAADARGRWPGVLGDESPLIVLVARETLDGLGRAHELLRQHHSGQAGAGRVLGLVTNANRPGRVPPEIRRYRQVIDELTPADGRWRIGWHADWPLTRLADLPTWTPGDTAPARGSDPLAAVRALGTQLRQAARAAVHDIDHPQPGKTAA